MSGQAKAMWITFGISFAAALMLAGGFFALAGLTGSDAGLARWGGAAWVFILGFIIALPSIAPVIKRRLRRE
jgi:membrane protein implicated in regulation of membrane protease activity